MSIKDVADVNPLPAKTIWYYEDIRLIMPSRAGNGYGLPPARLLPLNLTYKSFPIDFPAGCAASGAEHMAYLAESCTKVGSGSKCDLRHRLVLRLECGHERMGWMAPAPPGVSMRHNAGVIIC